MSARDTRLSVGLSFRNDPLVDPIEGFEVGTGEAPEPPPAFVATRQGRCEQGNPTSPLSTTPLFIPAVHFTYGTHCQRGGGVCPLGVVLLRC